MKIGQRGRTFAALIVVSLGLLTALAFVVLPAGARSPGPPHGWDWSSAAPGAAVSLDAHAGALAAHDGVDGASVREIAHTGGANGTLKLLMGRNVRGDRCLAKIGAIVQTSYACLTDLTQGDRALVVFPSFGGSNMNVVDRATLLGVARDDVAGLTVQTIGGSVHPVTLNRWRAFAYTADTAAGVPTAITAYGGGGGVLQTYQLDATPPAV